MTGTFFDNYQPMSFSGVVFPYKSYKIQGGIRKHSHEYPHANGAVNEKLGRKLYEVHVSASFAAALTDPRYPDLLDRLSIIRGLFEEQKTAKLIVPHIGEMTVCAENWSEQANGHNRSVIDAEFVFFEDEEEAFLIINPPGFAPAMADAVDKFNAEAERNKLLLNNNTTNIFSLINKTSASILAIKNQVDLYGELVIAKIGGFTDILRHADQQVKEINNPDFYPLLDALHELWSASVDLQRDVERSNKKLRRYTTPIRMSVSQISSTLFGDTSKAAEIMQLNGFDDPMSIPPGFVVNYYYDPGILFTNSASGTAGKGNLFEAKDVVKTR